MFKSGILPDFLPFPVSYIISRKATNVIGINLTNLCMKFETAEPKGLYEP